jgi:hypothetical protein
VLRLDDGHQLSDVEFDLLCRLLHRCPPYSSVVGMSHLQQEPEPTEECSEHIRCKRKFWMLHDEFKTMVLAALKKFNRDNVGFF